MEYLTISEHKLPFISLNKSNEYIEFFRNNYKWLLCKLLFKDYTLSKLLNPRYENQFTNAKKQFISENIKTHKNISRSLIFKILKHEIYYNKELRHDYCNYIFDYFYTPFNQFEFGFMYEDKYMLDIFSIIISVINIMTENNQKQEYIDHIISLISKGCRYINKENYILEYIYYLIKTTNTSLTHILDIFIELTPLKAAKNIRFWVNINKDFWMNFGFVLNKMKDYLVYDPVYPKVPPYCNELGSLPNDDDDVVEEDDKMKAYYQLWIHLYYKDKVFW